MEEIKLDAQIRTEIGKGKLGALRRTGFIPAVVYGEKEKSLSIKVSRKDFIHLLHLHKGENIIVNLNIKDGKKDEKAKTKQEHKNRTVLIKEIKYHPVKDEILHIDFYQISLTKKIQVKVPLVTKGEAPGVKQDGGTLAHLLWELEVECLPTQIPEKIEADVSNLKIGDAIHIRDLTVPEGVRLLHESEVIVLSVAAPMKEEVVAPEAAAAAGEAAPQEPEVIKKEKEVPEEEATEKPKEKEKEKEK